MPLSMLTVTEMSLTVVATFGTKRQADEGEERHQQWSSDSSELEVVGIVQAVRQQDL